jgi:hypothetical protein
MSQYNSITRSSNLFSSAPPSAGTTNSMAEGGGASQERRQLIDTLITPIIKIGKDSGYEIAENYDIKKGRNYKYKYKQNMSQGQ